MRWSAGAIVTVSTQPPHAVTLGPCQLNWTCKSHQLGPALHLPRCTFRVRPLVLSRLSGTACSMAEDAGAVPGQRTPALARHRAGVSLALLSLPDACRPGILQVGRAGGRDTRPYIISRLEIIVHSDMGRYF